MLETIINNAVGILCTAILTAALAYLARIYNQFKHLSVAVLSMGHDRLYQACTYFIRLNKITVEELKNIEYLYEGYHQLGGNGTGTELYNRVKNLPIVDDLDE